jgi:hypothetical protein
MARRRPTLRAARRLFRPGKIGHTRRGVSEFIGDSFLGISMMKVLAKRRADRNVLRVKSEDGVPGKGPGVSGHWPIPGRHGGGRATGIPIGTHTRDMTLEQFLSLRSPEGLKTHTLRQDTWALAQGRKINPVWEPKSEDCNDLEFWKGEVAYAHSLGLVPWGWALPKYHHILPVMKQAGVARVIKLKG